MPFIVGDIIRHVLLRAYQLLINKLDAGNPIPVRHLAMSLDIVLPAGEVPHEISPIHEIQLVRDKETQVLAKGRLHDRYRFPTPVKLHRLAFDLRPILVSLYMIRHRTIHTREEHVQLIHVFIIHIMARNVITVFFVRILFRDTGPYR